MTDPLPTFSEIDLGEVFPANPIREVDFEIRFTPRLRIQAELWRFQEELVSEYPDVSLESTIQPTGAAVNVTVFQNPRTARLIKVSPQNLAIAFSAYSKFEDFEEEVLTRVGKFCEIFEVTSLTRVGLRYVNEIPLPTQESQSLTRCVRPLLGFDRIPLDAVQQFAAQIVASAGDHMVTVRTAMIPGPIRTYILDIDAHTEVIKPAQDVAALLESFHHTVQRVFLDHITDEYKEIMRGQR